MMPELSDLMIFMLTDDRRTELIILPLAHAHGVIICLYSQISLSMVVGILGQKGETQTALWGGGGGWNIRESSWSVHVLYYPSGFTLFNKYPYDEQKCNVVMT